MKSRPWIRILAGISVVLVLGALILFVLQNTGLGETRNYRVRWIAKKLHVNLPPPAPLTPGEIAETKAEAAAWKAKFLTGFPALQVTLHPVAAEDNGFLQLFLLGRDTLVSEEFSQVLSDISSCDPELAKRCLAEHAELVAKAERIGSLRARSSTGMPEDFDGFIAARPAKQCSDILLLKARLAAEAGDENETLRLLSAVGNLAEHFRGVETPTFLSATVVVLIDLGREGIAFSTLLPALGKSADLERWKSLLSERPVSTAELANIHRGEWQTGADFMAFPIMAVSGRLGEMPDAEAVMHLYSSWVNEVVTKLPTVALADVEPVLSLPTASSKLSEEGLEMLEVLTDGSKAWIKGYVRAAAVHGQAQAAMDLLILEKSGVRLVAEDAARITHEPVGGQPFVFDPAKREVSVPQDFMALEIVPLRLPW